MEGTVSFIGGLSGSLVSVAAIAATLIPATSNLNGGNRALVLAIVFVLALLLGGTAGSAVGRRSRSVWGGLRLFSASAGAVCGGILGGCAFIAVTTAYLHEYALWPSDTLDVALAVVAVPVLGALGLCIGAVAGFCVGGLSGLALGIVVPKQR